MNGWKLEWDGTTHVIDNLKAEEQEWSGGDADPDDVLATNGKAMNREY